MGKIIHISASLSKTSILFFVLLLRFVFDLVYVVYIDPYYSYTGLTISFSLFNYFLSIGGVVFIFQLLPFDNCRPSSLISQFLFLMIYLPFSSYFGMSGGDYVWFLGVTSFWVLTLFMIQYPFNFKLPVVKQFPVSWFLWGVVSFIIVLLGLTIYYSGLHVNFDLYSVYELREKNPTGKIPFSGYSINWVAKSALPFILLFSLYRYKTVFNIWVLFVFVSILILFFNTGHKSFLFNIPFVLILYYLVKSKHFLLLFISSLLVISIIGLLFFWLFGDKAILTLFIRRSLYIPAQLSFYYHEFYLDQPLYLSNSFLNSLSDYPHHLEPAHMIANEYFNSDKMAANNGIISDGFKHFGYMGLVVWSVLLSLFLKFLDALRTSTPYLILIPLLILGSKSFIDGAFFTSLLTHGILISLLVLLFINVKKKNL